MQHRTLGTDGPEIPVIGLGAWPIGGGMGTLDDAQSIRTVRGAIDCGVTLIDSAQAYYTSESTLGRALRDGYRDRCFLATKVSRDYSGQGVRSAMENSLRDLGTSHIDLYQIHSWGHEQYPIEETMTEMARLQEEGKTRYIGVSNFNAKQMETAYGIAPFHSSQPRYNMFGRGIEIEDLPYCERKGIGNLAHSPLGKGLLTGRYAPGHLFPTDDEQINLLIKSVGGGLRCEGLLKAAFTEISTGESYCVSSCNDLDAVGEIDPDEEVDEEYKVFLVRAKLVKEFEISILTKMRSCYTSDEILEKEWDAGTHIDYIISMRIKCIYNMHI